MRVVFVASEGVPFSKTGGLADVIGALPKALAARGLQVDVILPRYRGTRLGVPVSQGERMTLPIPPPDGFKSASVQDAGRANGVQHYLVECPEFFDRDGLYQHSGIDHSDNYERFAAFSLAALEFIRRRFSESPQIIHCHDWQTALVPVYLRTLYVNDQFFRKASVVFTIHNIGYQGVFPPSVLPQILRDAGVFSINGLEYYGNINLLKGGILFSDFVTTVSAKYAAEIQTEEFGCGLEGVIRSRASRLRGILNGVDYEAWDPATDKLIPANYTSDDVKGKEVCKKVLLEKMGTPATRLDRPLIGIVSRFASQKGFDLIGGIAEDLMTMDIYVTVLGSGEPVYEELFRRLAEKYPDKFFVKVAYDNTLAHQIEAGADMFLMPSRYEPCGLNQIFSLKYGTVPIVRATGGLDDSIEEFDAASGRGTGFKFREYSVRALRSAIDSAIKTYRQPELWRKIVRNGMLKDLSWANAAQQYVEIYEELCRARS